MSWTKDASLKTKFLIPTLILALILLAGAYYTSTSINNMADENAEFIDVEMKGLSNLNALYNNGLQSVSAIRMLLINPEDKQAENNVELADKQFKESCENLKDADLKMNVNQIREDWVQLNDGYRQVLELYKNSGLESARSYYESVSNKQWRAIKNIVLDEIETYSANIKTKSIQRVSSTESTSTNIIIFVFVVSLLFPIIINILAGIFIKPLKNLSITSQKIANGDFSDTIVIESNDEIGQLANSIDKIMKSVKLMSDDANNLAKSASEGNLSFRADTSKHKGEFASVVIGMNNTLENVTLPLNKASDYLTRIAKGDIPANITEDYSGDFNLIKSSLNSCIDSVSFLVSEFDKLVFEVSHGKVGYKAESGSLSGDWAKMIVGINNTLDGITNIFNSASNLMIADSDGKINYMNQPVITLLTKYESEFRKKYPDFEVKNLLGVNIDRFHKTPANNRTTLSNLSTTPHIATINVGDEIYKLIVTALNDKSGSRLGYVVQWNNITNEARFQEVLANTIEKITYGELSARLDSNKIEGIYQNTADSVNTMLDSIVTPLNVAANYVYKISIGDMPPLISDEYKGDFNEIKNNLNACISNLNGLIADMNYMSDQHDAGDIDVIIDESKFQGAYFTMAKGVNDMVNGHISVKKKAMSCFKEFGEGNLNAVVEQFPGKKKFINEIIEEVRNNIKELINDAGMLANAAREGKLDTRAIASKHKGDFRVIVQGVNDTLDNVIGPLNVAADYVYRISKGDMPPIITDEYKGDFNEIKNNLNNMISALNGISSIATNISKGILDDEIKTRSQEDVLMISLQTMKNSIINLVNDVHLLANSAQSGVLDKRADDKQHQGEYRNIIEGINNMFEIIVQPINETISVLQSVADGDLTVSMTGNYQGDLFKLKKSVNDTIESISDVISQVKTTVDEVSNGSLQVSDASTALSQGATEQAASLEEITSSMSEIGSQTKTNAENANQANILANTAKQSAEKGSQEMSQLNKAMAEITDSSKNIAKIIKVIDEIAFQTNLLALNAAVEAARAGRHGKGFAVVAEEVRNLAARSATAAKETADLIETSIKLVENGSNLAGKTNDALDEIKIGNIKAADIVGEIATASNEQAQGIAQINEGLIQIDKVTQTNTASAEQSASAAEELSGQAAMLKNMVARFIVKNDSKSYAPYHQQSVRMISNTRDNSRRLSTSYPSEQDFGIPDARPEDIIKLDEDDFGRY